ncbi:phage distal tail protein [Nonomuraea sp. NPDC050227]|uniref:phage distal tail protein n=1 Tax=Nonomuraea sp. NPDC050227 TaxID=3364360 RepID=UPI00378746E3
MFGNSVTLGAFELEVEFPAIAVTTPDARVLLGPFETEIEFPPLAFSYDQRPTLGVFEIGVEFPPLSITVPIKPGDSLTGAAGEVEWNGTLWGPSTSVRVLLPVQGWMGTPNIDNLNEERPNRHGAWDARKLAQQRLVTLKLQPDSASDPTQIDTLLDQIAAVTGIPDSEDPLPLVVKSYGEPRLAYGQIIARDIELDEAYNVGLPTVSVLVACADPRRYSLERRGATVPLESVTGLGNAGNIATHPLIRVEGPAVDPTLANQTSGRILELSITLTGGQLLEIDTDNGTITLAGESRMSALTGASVPVQDFVLAPGPNDIQYSATSGGANGADFLWRDAWL